MAEAWLAGRAPRRLAGIGADANSHRMLIQ